MYFYCELKLWYGVYICHPVRLHLGCYSVHELTGDDLLSDVAGDGRLPTLPTEPLVGCWISTDGKPEGLRLPAIFVHPYLHTDEKG